MKTEMSCSNSNEHLETKKRDDAGTAKVYTH